MDKNIKSESSNETRYLPKTSNLKFIDLRLEQQDSFNEMEILSNLQELSKELIVSSDGIAEEIYCQSLIKKLINILNKFPLNPEIILNSIICLNAFLDINPMFTPMIIKNGGISNLVMMTQNIEFFEIAENSIKALEKISNENPKVLLDNNALINILNLVDFLDSGLKKSAVKACVNIIRSIYSLDCIKKYVIPAIPLFSNLIKLNGICETEKFILDQSIFCLYNIINSIKSHIKSKADFKIFDILDLNESLNNLLDILWFFLKNINETLKTPNKSMNINLETIKKIVKLFEILCSHSSEITNFILNMNILEMIKGFLFIDTEDNDQKFNYSILTIFPEIFALLISFFPNTNLISSYTKKNEYFFTKIMSEENKANYLYMSEKIISIFVNNFVCIPSTIAILDLIHLIELYVVFSPTQYIISFLGTSKFSNLIAKLVDLKESLYIQKVLFIVENIMYSCPEYFIEPFIREGIIDTIKYLYKNEGDINISLENCNKNESLSYNKEFYNNKYLYKNFDLINDVDNVNIEEEENKNNVNINTISNIESFHNVGIKAKIDILEKIKNPLYKEEKELIQKEVILNNAFIKTEIEVKTNEAKINVSSLNYAKCRDLLERFFTDSKMENYLKKGNVNQNPIENLNRLTYISSIFKEGNVDQISLKHSFEMLLNKNNQFTFYEIEKSGIFLNICQYIDQNYLSNIEKNRQKCNNLIITPDDNFIKRIYSIYNMLSSNNFTNEFISILQYSISNMNCFKLKSRSTETNFSDSYSNPPSANRLQNFKLKINFQYLPNDTLTNNLEKHLQKSSKNLNNTKISLSVDPLSTFTSIGELLMSRFQQEICEYTNLQSKKYGNQSDKINNEQESLKDKNLIDKDISKFENEIKFDEKTIKKASSKYEIYFYIKINEEMYLIDNNLSVSNLIKDIKYFLDDDDLIENKEFKILFELSNEENNTIKSIYSLGNIKQEDLNLLNSKIDKISYYQEKLFYLHYSEKILANKAIYNKNRLSPFLYLISLTEMCVNDYYDLFGFREKLTLNSLENQKVSTLLTKQLRDSNTILSLFTIPTWCKDICYNFPYLANFNSRYLYFKVSSYDFKRSIVNLANYTKQFLGETIIDDKTLSNNVKRKKFKVDRQNIILFAEKIYNEIGDYDGYLEIDYLNEIGTGNGPTLEFYSLFSKEIREKPDIWMKTSDLSLYPMPSENGVFKEEIKNLFFLIGYIMARGLYDDRLLDMPLNSVFWDIVLERPISLNKLIKIDKDVGRTILELSKLSILKEALLKFDSNIDLEKSLLYNNKKISDIDFYFTLPGTNINLKQNGSEIQVNSYNFEEYINLVVEMVCRKGIEEYVLSFKCGFNQVFDINCLKCFQSSEIEEIFCGSSKDQWDYSTLMQNIIPNHGYDKNSNIFKNMINILTEMTTEERKKFLLFVTGCPRLPLGGFKNLYPKLTIVKKNPDQPRDNPNNYLPTVMTCQNYLKIPDYSSSDVFKRKLWMAMTEGNNSFHFS